MPEPPLPADEARRLASLHALGLLDTPREERFDRITRTAMRLFDVPIVLISLVDANRQWFKSCYGLQIAETPRGISFCEHAILNAEAFVIPDAIADPRFADNPLVTSEPFIRFYAGYPLMTADGSRIGTLCIMDRRPRRLNDDDLQALRDLATWAQNELIAIPALEGELTTAYHEAAQDRAERERAEETLQQSEERYRQIIEHARDVIFTLAPDGTITSLNSGFEIITGWSRDTWIGQSFVSLVHPDDLTGAIDLFQRVLNGESPAPFELRIRAQAGGYVIGEFIAALRTHNVATTDILCIARDVTERRHAEAALQKERDLMEAIFETAGNLILVLDRQGRIIRFNRACEQLTGYTLDEIRGQYAWDALLPPQKNAPAKMAFEHLQVSQILGNHEYCLVARNGDSFLVAWSVTAILDDHGEVEYIIGTGVNITERRRAEQRQAMQYAITRLLADSTSVSEMIPKLLRTIAETFDWRMTIFWQTDHQDELLYCANFWHAPADELGRLAGLLRETAHVPQVGLPGLVWAKGVPIWKEQTNGSAASWSPIIEALPPGLCAIFAFPILLGREVLGVIECFAAADRQPDPSLLQMFASMGNQIGQFIEHRRAEEALRESEMRFRAIFDGSAIGIAQVSLDGRPIELNRAMRNLFGYSRDDMRAMVVPEYAHPDDMRASADLFREMIAGRRDHYQIEQRYSRKGGEPIWANLHMSLVCDTARRPQFAIAMIENITERKQAEEAARRSETKTRALLNAIPDMILLLDKHGAYLDLKADREHSSMATAGALLGRTVTETLPPDVAQQFINGIERALRTGQTHLFEYQLQHGDEVREFEARIVPNGDDEALAIVRNITERKKIDRMKREFISVVSHELRTPLTSIRGALGLLLGGIAGELPARAKELVDIACSNSERLVRLISDILDMEKIESGKMIFRFQPLDLLPLIEQAIEVTHPYGAQFGVRFVLKTNLLTAWVNADADRLMQVFTNLLSNAAKFSPIDDAVIVSLEHAGGYFRVAVTDHGPGIPESFHGSIFQKFAQADSSDTRQKNGTGLGLSISKAIVERLGGQIGFKTKAGIATTFHVDLPEHYAAPAIAPANLLCKPHILICEDDEDVAALLALLLQNGGFETAIAHTAGQARELLARSHFDGMTLDLALSGESGIDLIRELRSQDATRDLPIVVVSVTAEEGRDLLNGDAIGMIDWLEKPIDKIRLIAAVRRATQHQIHGKPHILHVEDDPDVREIVASILADTADVTPASSQAEARMHLQRETFDLIVLDSALPDGSGLDLLPLLRNRSSTTPVVVFSAHEIEIEAAHSIAATLVKSQTSNQKLLDTIATIVHCKAHTVRAL